MTLEMKGKGEFNSPYCVGHQSKSPRAKEGGGCGCGLVLAWLEVAHRLIALSPSHLRIPSTHTLPHSTSPSLSTSTSLTHYIYSYSSTHGLPVLRQRPEPPPGTDSFHTILLSSLQFGSTHPSPTTTTTEVRNCRNNKTTHQRRDIHPVSRYYSSRL